jgi:hypothetical protein
MRQALTYQLLQYRPSSGDLASIDAARHPGVAQWVRDSYEDRTTAQSIRWLRGYRRFGDVFERATQLDPHDPAVKLADPWYLAGLREEDFTPATRSFLHSMYERDMGSQGLSLFISAFAKLGNLPDNFQEQMRWAGGRYIVPKSFWGSWVNGLLGEYASTWTPENIDELMTAGVRRREMDKALAAVYGVSVDVTRNIHEQVLPDVPYSVVKAVVLDEVPVEYVRATLT